MSCKSAVFQRLDESIWKCATKSIIMVMVLRLSPGICCYFWSFFRNVLLESHVKRGLAVFLAACVSGAAFTGLAQAQGRPDSLRMSCAAARSLVSTRGAVVLGSGPDIYDRYVATQGFCQRVEITKPAWVATGDMRQCFVGYLCARVDDDFRY